jgi:hypothetical protein
MKPLKQSNVPKLFSERLIDQPPAQFYKKDVESNFGEFNLVR